MKMAFVTLLFLLSGFAQATVYTFCKDGTQYTCGAGDACHPIPCYPSGMCPKKDDSGSSEVNNQEDTDVNVSELLDAVIVDKRSCL